MSPDQLVTIVKLLAALVVGELLEIDEACALAASIP